jgi:hypothetical protein
MDLEFMQIVENNTNLVETQLCKEIILSMAYIVLN